MTGGGRVKAGILGSADGVTSIAGVVAGGAGAGVGHAALAVTAIGGAFAATVSMGGAEMLSEAATDWSNVEAMAVGTLGGAALPAVPLLALTGALAWVAVLLVSLVIAVTVGEVRHRNSHQARSVAWAQTLAVLVVGAAVGYAAGRLL